MNICLVTTTIHLPHVLAEYRRIGPDMEIIVAGDVTGPQAEIADFCRSIDARYLSYEEQGRLGYAVHDIIGPRVIQRRNIAILEAIRSGADLILSLDTDNEVVADDYFVTLRRIFQGDYRAVVATGERGWFDYGMFGEPAYSARGMPLPFRRSTLLDVVDIGPTSNVGIVQSLVYEDPDISAIERIERAPIVTDYTWPMKSGIIIDPRHTWSVLNTQSTTWRRELAPLMACSPAVGRFDDILAGWISQRVAAEFDWQVFYGPPFVKQIRHPHDLVRDLEDELWGMRYGEQFCADIRAIDLTSQDAVLGKLALLIAGMSDLDYLPQRFHDFEQAWLQDVERIY